MRLDRHREPAAGPVPDAACDGIRGDRSGLVVTARDYGSTFDLLEARGVTFRRVGTSYGKPKWRKATGLLGRTTTLTRVFARRRPDAAVHAGRASALAATVLRVPWLASATTST